MKTVTATAARSAFCKLIDVTLSDHEPIRITGKRGNAVLVAESNWRASQERFISWQFPVSGSRSSEI